MASTGFAFSDAHLRDSRSTVPATETTVPLSSTVNEDLSLGKNIGAVADFEGIVGQSSALRQVLQLVETVATSGSTVLLLGETGTGKEMIAGRQFRSDLYYRLNVFPIRVPPLRERPEDIPLLVQYFGQKYARRMQKRIESIPAAAMRKLMRWHWPGNVRELQNLVERAVIMTHNSTLAISAPELANSGGDLNLATLNNIDVPYTSVRIL